MDRMEMQENIQPVTENLERATIPNAAKKKKWPKKIMAVIVSLCILAVAITPYPLGFFGKALDLIVEEPIDYPYVLVHGFNGWGAGSGINETLPYWGATTGNLSQYLATQGYVVYEASVGPFSSTWDRTCELYAQLTGTTVDYGEAHAKAHNHARYGRTYEEPLFENWGSETVGGQRYKINLVGHSFGGPTIRLLTSLLANGAEEEKQAGGDTVSPLFEGGHGDWVNSVTALSASHNGTTLAYIFDEYKAITLMKYVYLAFAGVIGNSPLNGYIDFQLEQFGITCVPGEKKSMSEMSGMLKKIFSTGIGTDHAAYEVTLDGAAQLNKMIKPVESVVYISYSYCTTKESDLTGNQLPELDTLPALALPAMLMGCYAENTMSDFEIDKTWLPNDGLVNVVSARYPFGEPWKEFDAENIESGKWNVMPTRSGDHGRVIGLNAGTEETHRFYTQLFSTIDSIPREKNRYFKY